jgi:hypothetical protein
MPVTCVRSVPRAGPSRAQRCVVMASGNSRLARAEARARRHRKYRNVSCSSLEVPMESPSPSLNQQQQAPSAEPIKLADVITWTINLPWQKIASWAAVVLVVSRLNDFFGVRSCFLLCFTAATACTWTSPSSHRHCSSQHSYSLSFPSSSFSSSSLAS